MANCLFCYPDRTLGNSVVSTSLSGGSWSGSLPLNNLKDAQVTKVARSASAAEAHTQFLIDLGTTRNTKLIALIYTNLSNVATFRFKVTQDSAGNNTAYDTGITLVPYTFVNSEDLIGWKPNIFFVLPDGVSGRYVHVSLSDTTNASGFVEVGRCLVMSAWTPDVNIDFGSSIQYAHNTTVESNIGGSRVYDRRQPVRVTIGKLNSLNKQEAHIAVLEMQRKLGIDQELFFVYDPDETDIYAQQRSYLATLEEISPLEDPYVDNHSWGFKLREVL